MTIGMRKRERVLCGNEQIKVVKMSFEFSGMKWRKKGEIWMKQEFIKPKREVKWIVVKERQKRFKIRLLLNPKEKN